MKKTFIITFKIITTISIVFFLVERIYNQYDKIGEALETYLNYPWILFIVVLLMPLNWMLESLKWKLSVKPIVDISIQEATVGVLSGISLGFVTPHAIGDYFARIWSLEHHDRKKAIGPILLNRIAQMLPTILFGCMSLLSIYDLIVFPILNLNSNYPTVLIVISLLLFISAVVLFIGQGHRLSKFRSYVDVMRKIAFIDYFKICSLSFFRYGVFAIQFMILLSLFDLNTSLLNQFLGIAFIFLSKSVLPTFNFFNDLGIREFSAVIFFDLMEVNTGPIILASLLLWLINIALPALIGLFFIKKFKIDLK